jgi:hypothetical protein
VLDLYEIFELNLIFPKINILWHLTFIGPCLVIYSYSKTDKMCLFLKLFMLVKHSTCFGRSFHPSSRAQDYACSNRHMSNSCCYLLLAAGLDRCLLLYAQSWAPDDGRKDRLKHVECFTRINNLRDGCIMLLLL